MDALPGFPTPRGIVIAAGGPVYLTCAYICVGMLRSVGCVLPIQIWHAGRDEVDAGSRAAFADLGVEFVDAAALAAAADHPGLRGWPIKSFAIRHCPFREVLFIDADNMPVRDPTFLFDEPLYREHGALFWPDRCLARLDDEVWAIAGVTPREEPEFESGQLIIDKARCWAPLCVAERMNRDSDFWYRYVHGDKDTFRLAWHAQDRRFGMIPHAPGTLGEVVILQRDPDGDVLFQHRGGDKWRLDVDPRRLPGFRFERECLALLERFRIRRLQGSGSSGELAAELLQAVWIYTVEGIHERRLEFAHDGAIGIGAGNLEAYWRVEGDELLLVARDRSVSARLRRQDGGLVGHWQRFGKRVVALRPAPDQERIVFAMRPQTGDARIFQSVYLDNEYGLAEDLRGATVLDVGAHIGSFTRLCQRRGAGRILAFEPEPENYRLLARNTEDHPQCQAFHAAVGRSDGKGGWRCRIPTTAGTINTGGNQVLSDEGSPVVIVPLDDILRDVGCCDLLKMDCEGAEYPILYTSRELRRVGAIVGEFHVVDEGTICDAMRVPGAPYDMEHLAEHLERLGMEVSWERTMQDVGRFYAGWR